MTREYTEVFKLIDKWSFEKFGDKDEPLTDLVIAIDDLYEKREKLRIEKKKSIKIPFSEEDLSELLNGETFDWTFDNVDVHLFLGDEEDEEIIEEVDKDY